MLSRLPLLTVICFLACVSDIHADDYDMARNHRVLRNFPNPPPSTILSMIEILLCRALVGLKQVPWLWDSFSDIHRIGGRYSTIQQPFLPKSFVMSRYVISLDYVCVQEDDEITGGILPEAVTEGPLGQ
jgi:hypothetical protein